MKHKITIILILFSFYALAQNESSSKEDLGKELQVLKSNISLLERENGILKTKIKNFDYQFSLIKEKIDSLDIKTQNNSKILAQTANELDIKIANSESKSFEKLTEVDNSLSKKSLLGIIGFLLSIIVFGLLYWLLSNRQKSDKSDIINQLSQTKSSIEESLVKQFGKQTELMEAQVQLLEQQKSNIPSASNQEPDHSLALKVASEINLIERNINLMDAGTKGLKQLVRSVGKLKDNLAANGYEMPELLGKQFHQGMKVIVVSTIQDENLHRDEEIISKVLIPQVNYNDIMIQAAQIETTKGI